MSVVTGLCNCNMFVFFSTATKADGFALYFLGECNNVSAEDIFAEYIFNTNAVVCMYLTFFPLLSVLVYASQ